MAFKRDLINSTSGLGVAMPCMDFFWKQRTIYTARYASPWKSSTTSTTPAPPKPFIGLASGCFCPTWAKCSAYPKVSCTASGMAIRSFLLDATQRRGLVGVGMTVAHHPNQQHIHPGHPHL